MQINSTIETLLAFLIITTNYITQQIYDEF